jgi:hypothetical protein
LFSSLSERPSSCTVASGINTTVAGLYGQRRVPISGERRSRATSIEIGGLGLFSVLRAGTSRLYGSASSRRSGFEHLSVDSRVAVPSFEASPAQDEAQSRRATGHELAN